MMQALAENLWIVGALIVGAALAYALWRLIDSVRQSALQAAQRRRATQLLDVRLEAARGRRDAAERKSLHWTGWRKFTVRKKKFEDPERSVCSFHLEPHDEKPIAPFEPGQFLTFQLHVPGQARPIVRCYSLSDCPRPQEYRVSIKKAAPPRGTDHPPGVASCYMHDVVKEGDILDVRAPSGNFVLDLLDDRPAVLIGGGVGVTPMLSMLNAVVDSGGSRETWFFHGVRHQGEQIMKQHVERIAGECENVNIRICYSSPTESDVEGRDYQHAGYVDVALLKKQLPSNNYDFFVCGPPPMMNSIVDGLKEWGVPEDRVHFERFGPGAPKKKAVAAPADAGQPAIEVTFARSGKTVPWSSGNGTLLDLARAHDIAIDAGCEQGNCGTCQTAIRSGKTRHLEDPAYDYEQGTCLVCCSVPDGAVELDA